MTERLRYLIMRCTSCKRFLTRLEIVGRWEEMEAAEEKALGICPCGGRQIKPSNLTDDERKHYEGIWPQILYRLGFRNERTRVVELYEKCVKGKELDKEVYQ